MDKIYGHLRLVTNTGNIYEDHVYMGKIYTDIDGNFFDPTGDIIYTEEDLSFIGQILHDYNNNVNEEVSQEINQEA